ncbi:cohesin subunit SA-2-like isoform X2 [Protopterus annectens]|uniref:cohesin subunit SA-2-like isoform X2 n=1 Tax=Protopterus annectens TaxID=7888 RepID=UPI001CFADF34|nr:cohesin subunit SA-2-like isoform X2 [Protopterus annectens]
MIAEQQPTPFISYLKENELTPRSVVQDGKWQLNISSLKTPKLKRKIRKQSENRRHSSSPRRACLPHDHLRNGDVEAVTLYEVISMGKSAMQSVVDDWLEVYKQDRDAALLDLISFFIQCSGCQGLVTAEMFQSKQKNEVMQKMTESFDEETGLQYKRFMAYPWILTVTWRVDGDNGDYPLAMAGPQWKKFKCNLCEFLTVLIQQCEGSVIYDGYLVPVLITVLTELSNSRIRAFRHTGTLSALKVMTALVSVIANLRANIGNMQRLQNMEKKKMAGKKTSPQIDQLQQKKIKLQQKQQDIEDMTNAIFKGAFLQRYRDVIPEIRAICMEELGIWMKLHTGYFLNDNYLKYVGWMLYDKQPEVRLRCLLALQGLYSRKELIPKLSVFSKRFKGRIVSMILDEDKEIAVQAVRLVGLMSENCKDAINSKDCNTLHKLLYSTHRPLAAAAGDFLCKSLLPNGGSDQSRGNSFRRKGITRNAQHLKMLLTSYLDNKFHQHVTYLVDSLWDSATNLLKDWECITTLLLKHCCHQEEVLSSAQESALIELLSAAVRQAAEGHPPPGRGTVRKVLTAKEKKLQSEDCMNVTQHFLVVLPRLLSKYSCDAEKVALLLQIPQHFDTDICSREHMAKHLDDILTQINHVTGNQSGDEVLEACSRTYQVFCQEGLPIYSRVKAALSQLIDDLVGKLDKLLDVCIKKGEGLCSDEETIFQMSSVLKKIAAFHNAHDLSEWNVNDRLSRILTVDTEHGRLPDQENIFRLRIQMRRLCQTCRHLLTRECTAVREKGFSILCDILLIFSHKLQSDEVGERLVYIPDSSLESELLKFVQLEVFQESKVKREGSTPEENENDFEISKCEDVHKRRNLLAAYCKLIVFNVIETSAAAELYKQYIKYYGEFGDIIKETLSRTRQNDKLQSARTLIICLQQLFTNHMENSTSDATPQSLTSVKELARRFSLTFGWDQVKSRESVAMMHKDGIEFAFKDYCPTDESRPPSNLSFLTILNEFTYRLLAPDKRTVYCYLQRFVTQQTLACEGDEWLPLANYRNTLLACGDEDISVTKDSSLMDSSPEEHSKMLQMKLKFTSGNVNSTAACHRTPDLPLTPQLTSTAIKSRKRLWYEESSQANPTSSFCTEQVKSSSQSTEENSASVPSADIGLEDVDVDITDS